MKLRGINYGPVCGASGVQGFYGEGYSWHRGAKFIGLDFGGMTFVAKTVTSKARAGNMDGRLLPRCIIAKPFRRDPVGLNSVGLTNEGASAHLSAGRWQQRTEPFMLSFMSVASTKQERLQELRAFVRILQPQLPHFQAPVALQLNVSCPNAHVDIRELSGEITKMLDIAQELNIPILIKLNALFSWNAAVEFAEHPACDGICISNTIPWRSMEDLIDWDRYFGPDKESPLKKRGFTNGGLSGAPLLNIVRNWVLEARQAGFTKAINAGGGILKPIDAIMLLRAGADSVFIGSMAFLRPWQVRATIRAVHAWHQENQP